MFLAATGVIFSFCLRSILAQSTRDIGQLFEINGLVPDLLQSFDPTVLLQVSYSFTLVPGEILSQNATAVRPNFAVQGLTQDSEFVLIMVDPDDQPIPNPDKIFTQFLHMIAPGMTISDTADSQGFYQLVNNTPAIVDYVGPGAKTGSPLHRYAFLLYPQPATFSSLIPAPERKDFNLTQFISTSGLSEPIGGNMMMVGDPTSGPSIIPAPLPSVIGCGAPSSLPVSRRNGLTRTLDHVHSSRTAISTKHETPSHVPKSRSAHISQSHI